MTLYFTHSDNPGGSFRGTLERPSDNFIWNNSSLSWASSVAFATRCFTYTEGSGEQAGSYTALFTPNLGAGLYRLRVHDANASNRVIPGATELFAVNSSGAEVFNNNVDVEKIDGVSATQLAQSVGAMGYGSVRVPPTATTTTFSALLSVPVPSSVNQLRGRSVLFSGTTTTPGIRASVSPIVATSVSSVVFFNFTLDYNWPLPVAPGNGDIMVIL